MKVLSLFDGISCARVALERVGIPVEEYYASEIDNYAIEVSKKNWPEIIYLGCVKNISIEKPACVRPTITGEIDINLLIGGSPCQDLSIAKKNRKGLEGDRSGLFWEYVRILNEIKPKYFILENVASMPKEAKELISKTLGVEPIMINAGLVSAQNRKRLFWVGKINDRGGYEQIQIDQPEDRGILLKDILQKNVKDDMPENYIKWLTSSSGQRRIEKGFIKINPEKAKGLMARNYANWSGNLFIQYRRGNWRNTETGKVPTLTANNGIRKLTPIECERLQGLPDNYTEGVLNTQRYKCLGNAFNVDVVAHILSFIK